MGIGTVWRLLNPGANRPNNHDAEAGLDSRIKHRLGLMQLSCRNHK